VLAWLQQEPGSDRVTPALDGGVVTAANWSEVLQKARQFGGDPYEVGLLLRSLGIDVIDVTQEDGEVAALIWTREAPLSLGDRLCLAAATRLGQPVMTADTEWEKVDIEDLQIEMVRRK
jgi:ribonuclease VapC